MKRYRIIIAQTPARTHTSTFFIEADAVGTAMRKARQQAAEEWGLADPAAVARMEIVRATEI